MSSSSFYEPFNYPTVPIFNQDYEEGALTGNDGWVGSVYYIVRKPAIGEKYVYALHGGSGAQHDIMHNTGTVDLDDDINRILFSGYLGVSLNDRTYCYAAARLTDGINDLNDIVCGIRLIDTLGLPINRVGIGFYDSAGGGVNTFTTADISPDTLYPFSLIYNRTLQKYETLTFNSVEYDISVHNTTNSQNRPRTLVIHRYQKNTAGWVTYYDNFSVSNADYIPPKTHTRFPKWQKTKYGMRPYY